MIIQKSDGKCIEIWTPNVEEILKGGKPMENFNKIKSFRVGAGITQDQMAEKLGMSTKTYKSREDNRTDWKLSEMNAFVNAINEAIGENYSIKDIFF